MGIPTRHRFIHLALCAALMAGLLVTLPASRTQAAGCDPKVEKNLKPPEKMLRDEKNQPPQPGSVLGKVTWFSMAGKHLRVWWWKGHKDSPQAKQIVCEIEPLAYPAFSGVMQTEQDLNDGRARDPGPDDKIDVAIMPQQGFTELSIDANVDAATSPFFESCKPTPSFMITRQKANLLGQEFKETFVHELFHAFQYWKDASGGCIIEGGAGGAVKPAKWLAESTAEWASHWLYRNYEHQHSHIVLDDPHISIFDPSNTGRAYGSYLFFIYGANMPSNKLVARVFNQRDEATNVDQFDALDAAINGGLRKAWPDFVAENFHKAAGKTESYLTNWMARSGQGLALTRGAKIPEPPTEVGVNQKVTLDKAVAPLSAQYWELTMPNSGIRKVVIRNKFDNADAAVQVFRQFPDEDWTTPRLWPAQDRICRRPDRLLIAVSNASRSNELPANMVEVETSGDSCSRDCRFQETSSNGCPSLTGTLQYSRTWDQTDEGFDLHQKWDGTLDIRLKEAEGGGWIDDGTGYSLQGSGSSKYVTSLCTVDTTSTWAGSGLNNPNYFERDSKVNLRISVEVDGTDNNTYSGSMCSGSDSNDVHEFWVVECSNGEVSVDPDTSQLRVTFGPELDVDRTTPDGAAHETQGCSGVLETSLPPPEG